jgi:hypothetical protein
MFPGIILRILRLEVSVYNVYLTNQCQTTFAQGGGSNICSRGDRSKEENFKIFFVPQLRPRIRPLHGMHNGLDVENGRRSA